MTDDDPSLDDIRKMPLGLISTATDELVARTYIERKKHLLADTARTAELAAAKEAACATTLGSGFLPGQYSGDMSQRVTGRDGSKVAAWKSLTLKVDARGCLTWYGLSFIDIAMPGDATANLDVIPHTCMNEGDGVVVGPGPRFKLAATVRGKASGGTPIRSHLWKCPGIGNVQADMSVNLRDQNCQEIASLSDAGEQRGADATCQLSEDFAELRDVTLTVATDGTVRVPVTIADHTTLVLRRIDKRQPSATSGR